MSEDRRRPTWLDSGVGRNIGATLLTPTPLGAIGSPADPGTRGLEIYVVHPSGATARIYARA